MTVKISQSSRTDVNGQNVHASKTRADSLAFALKLGTKLYALSFKAEKKSETKKLLSGAAKRLNGEVEKVLIGIFGSVANLLLTQSYKLAEVSLTTPLKYLSLVFAIVLGFFIFQEIPSTWTIFGSLLIVISSLIIFTREHALKKSVIMPRQQ